MTLRKTLFWTHLIVGLSAGLIILSMCVTGAMLAYEPQIVDFADRHVRTLAPPPDKSRLDIETLLSKAMAVRPNARPGMLTLRSDPSASAMVGFTGDGAVYLNPYTGAVLGEGSKVHAFLDEVEEWHRWFGSKEIGKPITSAAVVLFFGLAISGLILWWPRKMKVADALTYKAGLAGKARDWNWHTVTGFWFSPVFIVITLTGMVMAFPWANALLYRIAGSPPPALQKSQQTPGKPPPPDPVVLNGLNTLWTRAEAQSPGWRSITLRFAPKADAPVTFWIVEPTSPLPTFRSQLKLDRKTGEAITWEPYAGFEAGKKWRYWIVPLHTGRAWGILGQTLNFLSALAGILLIWTGFAMAWRRFKNRKTA